MDAPVRQGLKVSFLVVTALMAGMIGGSFLLDYFDPQLALISRLAPAVPGHHCLLCGMTHAFLFCSRGEFRAAAGANPLGPAVYFFSFLLTALGIITVLRDWGIRRCTL